MSAERSGDNQDCEELQFAEEYCKHDVGDKWTNSPAMEPPNAEEDLSLQPLEQPVTTICKQASARRLHQAAVSLELEAIEAAERKVQDLTLQDLGYQYGIRHLIVASLLVASVLALWKNLGLAAGLSGLCMSLLIAALYFVSDWEYQHRWQLAERKKKAYNKEPPDSSRQ